MTAAFVDLAAALGLPVTGGTDAVVALVRAALARRADWLLIYDNVEDVSQLRDLPTGGHVIVTCGDRQIAGLMPVLAVDTFTRGESTALLNRRAPHLTAGDADQIAAATGDLPLAVAQAAAYLATTDTSPTDYLNRLTTGTPRPLAEEPSPSAPPAHAHPLPPSGSPGLAGTVAAALDTLAVDDPAALDLLHQLAFLASEPIPLTAASADTDIASTGGLVVGDPATTAELVQTISRLDLARTSGTRLQINRHVQTLVRDRLSPSRRATVLTRALRLLGTASPGDPDDPGGWPAYADLTPHLQAAATHLDDLVVPEPASFRHLLLEAYRYLYVSGQYQQAQTLSYQTRHRWAATLGDDHPDTLTSANNLAAALYGLGEYQAARQLDEDTLARRRRVLGDDHPDTLHPANNLGTTLYGLGEDQAARQLFEDTLDRYRRVLGDDHPDTLHPANNLAADLRGLGDYRAARQLDEDTLDRRRRILGDDHPDTLASANNLAADLRELGEMDSAEVDSEEGVG